MGGSSFPADASSYPVDVRAVKADDLDAVTKIYAHHVLHGTGTFELEPPDRTVIAARIAAVEAVGLPYLVGLDEAGVAGFAYAGPYRTRPAYRQKVEDSIYLRPDAVGRGVGTALLSALIAACEAWGARQVVAVIGDSANTASVRLHDACGFSYVGTLRSVGWKHGRWLDTVIMQRALGPGDASPPG